MAVPRVLGDVEPDPSNYRGSDRAYIDQAVVPMAPPRPGAREKDAVRHRALDERRFPKPLKPQHWVWKNFMAHVKEVLPGSQHRRLPYFRGYPFEPVDFRVLLCPAPVFFVVWFSSDNFHTCFAPLLQARRRHGEQGCAALCEVIYGVLRLCMSIYKVPIAPLQNILLFGGPGPHRRCPPPPPPFFRLFLYGHTPQTSCSSWCTAGCFVWCMGCKRIKRQRGGRVVIDSTVAQTWTALASPTTHIYIYIQSCRRRDPSVCWCLVPWCRLGGLVCCNTHLYHGYIVPVRT